MKLLAGTENRIIKDKNSKKLPILEVTEVILVNYNVQFKHLTLIQKE